ncbi:hypothetical protein BLNAU_9822 [Blattamonas nauphoetae]|uniref:Uncharacterized protein n=1 Tax=Blattamonas nauphoetae TaxID=2049346 RepID=A0ABQ9XUW9_9EUKA|nr:hypothetical protein BLNAU_9822 [Blattamonas nauphoetae]
MAEIDKKPDTFSSATRSDLSSSQLPFSMDCSRFLNWDEKKLETENEKVVVFWSLVATLKLQPALDDSLEAKALKFLKCVDPQDTEPADAFLSRLASNSDHSSPEFVQSIMVLISCVSQNITTATMAMVRNVFGWCSYHHRLALIKADMLPQLINTLNPQSLSFVDAVGIHTCLVLIISISLWLTTPDGLDKLGIEEDNEQQAVHKTVFQQVVIPSEKYIWHLCVNRFSIVDGDQSENFLDLLAQLLQISPYYQPTMAVVVNMPILLTIPSCLTFFEHENSIYLFLSNMNHTQREWNDKMGIMQKMGRTIHRMLRMDGIEDVMEEKLQHDSNKVVGRLIIADSIRWNNLLGMNLPRRG